MIPFYILAQIVGALFATYSFFIVRRSLKFFNSDLSSKRILAVNLASAFAVYLCCINPRSFTFIVVVQLVLCFAVMDVIRFLVFAAEKISGKNLRVKVFQTVYGSCLLPVAVVAVLSVYGAINMTQIYRTEYTVSSPFIRDSYKILFISDLHYGTIQNPRILEQHIEQFNKEDLDLVIFGGDLCDESTSFLSMQNMFDTLGQIKSRFGSYFVFGNHDRQLYSSNPQYSTADFEKYAQDSGIRILKDSGAIVAEDLAILGREDLSTDYFYKKSRKSVTDFFPEEALCTKFLLVADHQPKKSAVRECLSYRCGLQLSGHTHAGQIFPFGQILKLFGGYVYGKYTEVDESSKIDLIVSSGFTGWGYPMRTEQHCEYVIVNLVSEEI